MRTTCPRTLLSRALTGDRSCDLLIVSLLPMRYHCPTSHLTSGLMDYFMFAYNGQKYSTYGDSDVLLFYIYAS